jgi:hypothetical protein
MNTLTGFLFGLLLVTTPPLEPEQWAVLLETIEEANAGEAFWVVVQDEDLTEDLLLRFEREETELQVSAEARVPRSDANFDDPRGVYRSKTGKATPRKGSREVIVQTFRRRIVAEYRYTPVPMENREGLLALLDPEDLLRESHRVPGAETPLTVAVVFRNAVFVPSACEHAGETSDDLAEASLVLVDRTQVLERFVLDGDNSPVTRWPRNVCGSAEQDRVPLLSWIEGTEEAAARFRFGNSVFLVRWDSAPLLRVDRGEQLIE